MAPELPARGSVIGTQIEDPAGQACSTHSVARPRVQIGDKDRAIEWLERAYEARCPMMCLVGIDFMPFNSVRDDPRFLALLEKMGLGEFSRRGDDSC